MRILGLVVIAAALSACASANNGVGEGGEPLGRLPFPVERGSAAAPPSPGSGHVAPPEGPGAAGLDFGQWRSADPAIYAPAFQAQVRDRFAGRTNAQIRADLEANGFACEDAQRLDCRVEIMERQCAYDWYVVVERARPEPVAGFDQMCLGAR